MKTYILALALALFVLPASVGAKENPDSSSADIAEKIQNSVRLDNDESSRVFVVFSITENGTVLVHEVGTADPSVKASITEQFQAMTFDNTNSSYDGMYSIWLNFKSL